jgi:hypothetical protein
MISDEELEGFNMLTEKIIGCAIEVHRSLGPGLLEHTYEAAMCVEMNGRVLRTGVRRFLLDHLRAL